MKHNTAEEAKQFSDINGFLPRHQGFYYFPASQHVDYSHFNTFLCVSIFLILHNLCQIMLPLICTHTHKCLGMVLKILFLQNINWYNREIDDLQVQT